MAGKYILHAAETSQIRKRGQVGGGRWRGHDGAAYRKGESRAGPDSDAGRADEGRPAERRAVVELFRPLVLVG